VFTNEVVCKPKNTGQLMWWSVDNKIICLELKKLIDRKEGTAASAGAREKVLHQF